MWQGWAGEPLASPPGRHVLGAGMIIGLLLKSEGYGLDSED